MDLMRLRYFTAVAEIGHMQRAADALHVSQSTLSSAVKRLEEELGLKLFQRVGRRLELNDNGRLLLRDAKALLQQAARLEQKMMELRRQQVQTVTIATLVPDFSAPALAAFQREQDTFSCALLHSENESAACRALEQGYADAALSLSALTSPKLESNIIFTDETRVLCCTGTSLPAIGTVTLEQLVQLPFLTLPTGSGFDQFCTKAFLSACLPIPGWQRLQAPEAIPFAVQHGQGVSFISRSAFTTLAPRFPDLCALPLTEPLPWHIWLTLPTRPSPGARLLARFFETY